MGCPKITYSHFHEPVLRCVWNATGSQGGCANMEESRAAEESQYFENVDATRADRPFNYPDKNPVNTKVSKVPGKSEGLKLTLKVMAGDTIEISAKAFYNMDNTYPGASVNVAPIIGGILAGITNPAANLSGEVNQLLSGNSEVFAGKSTALPFSPPSEGAGEAHDENNLVKPKSGINFAPYNSNTPNMKKGLLFFILLFVYIVGIQAQRDFRKGYIITNGQDTLYGWIDYRGDIRNAKICSFKKTESEQVTEYTPSDIAAYRFIDGKYYESKNIGSVDAPDLIFLEYLVNGLVKLYHYRDGGLNSRYYIEKDSRIVELKTEESEIEVAESIRIKTQKSHVDVLKTILNVQEMRDEIEKSKLEHSSLIDVAKKYHQYICTDGSECIVYEKEKTKPIVRVAPVAGVDFSLLKVMNRNKPNYYPERSTSFVCGVNLNMSMREISEKLFVQMEALYSKYTMSYFWETNQTLKQTTDVHIQSNILKLGLGIKYEYPKGKWRPTLTAGMSAIYMPDGSITEKENTYSHSGVVSSTKTTTYDFPSKLGWGAEITPGIHYHISHKRILFAQMQYARCYMRDGAAPFVRFYSFRILTGIYF